MKKNEQNKLFRFAYNKEIENIIEEKISWVAKLNYNERKNNKTFARTKKYLFYKNLFDRMTALDQKIKDLHITKKLIFEYKNIKNKNDITKSECIIYHLEYYYINIVGIYDRMLHFVNFIYNLGLNDRFIQKDIIINNNKVDNNIKKFLKEFDKKITAIRRDQNRIKHKDKYYDNKMYNYELFEFASRGEKKLKIKKQYLNISIKHFVKYKNELNKYLERNIESITRINEDFLELLKIKIIKENNKFNK